MKSGQSVDKSGSQLDNLMATAVFQSPSRKLQNLLHRVDELNEAVYKHSACISGFKFVWRK